MFPIVSVLPTLPRLKVVDVGAMSIPGSQPPYARLVKMVGCDVIGFEAVAAECEPMSQMLWGDAIYVRDFMTFDTLPPPSLLKLAAILHENYRSFDLAALALAAHDRQTGGDLQGQYRARFQGGGQPS